ncbi:hypothetical protein GCM10027061_26410 [Nesterenkonia suensis]
MARRHTTGGAAVAAILLAVTACGNDLPSGPMDEHEVETVFLTGRAVPEGWDLQGSPTGRDRFGDSFDSFGPLDGQLGETSEECTDVRAAGDEELAAMGMVAEASASYVNGGALTEVEVFSTDGDVDVAGLALDMFDACEGDLLEDLGRSTGLDSAAFEASSADTEADGVRFVNDGAHGGAFLFVMASYGNNHFAAFGFSSDPRDVESMEGFIDEAQNRFEQGPDESGSEGGAED